MSTPDPWIDGEQVLREPPPGYIVDFDNPQRTGVPEVYYLAGFGIFLSVLSMAQRLYVKLFILKRLQADDCEYATFSIHASNGLPSKQQMKRQLTFCD